MLITRLAPACAVAAVALATVTGCASSSDAPPHASSTQVSPTKHPSASVSDQPTSADPSFVNGGAALANDDHLIYVLEAVNPKIGTNKTDLIGKSKSLCARINANDSGPQLETAAAKRFTNGAWVPSPAEAQAIVGTVKAYGGC